MPDGGAVWAGICPVQGAPHGKRPFPFVMERAGRFFRIREPPQGGGRFLRRRPGRRTGAPHAERGGSMMSGTAPGRIDELFSEVDGGVPAMQPENAA